MFRHVVMLKFTEEATEEQKAALREGLTTLPEKVPVIRAYRFGADAGLNAGNFDFVIVADFDDLDAYLTYRDDPVHQGLVAELIKPILAERVAVQHEWAPALPQDLPG